MLAQYRVISCSVALGITAFAGAGLAQQQHSHAVPSTAAATDALVVSRVVPSPAGFIGNVTFDSVARRLWLVAYGPPANTFGPSALYELDPDTGRTISHRPLPLRGQLATPAYLDGALYQPVAYESRLYRIAVDPPKAGEVVNRIALPTMLDLKPDDGEVYRFPYVEFTAAVALERDSLLLYAADLGEFVTIEPSTGRTLSRVRTARGLAGMTLVPDPAGPYVLATFDPVDAAFKEETRRFMFRASHGILPLETVRAEGNYGNPGQKTTTWVLLDPRNGEALASVAVESTRITPASIALVRREPVPGRRYGKLVAFAIGNEGLLTVEWTPR